MLNADIVRSLSSVLEVQACFKYVTLITSGGRMPAHRTFNKKLVSR